MPLPLTLFRHRRCPSLLFLTQVNAVVCYVVSQWSQMTTSDDACEFDLVWEIVAAIPSLLLHLKDIRWQSIVWSSAYWWSRGKLCYTFSGCNELWRLKGVRLRPLSAEELVLMRVTWPLRGSRRHHPPIVVIISQRIFVRVERASECMLVLFFKMRWSIWSLTGAI